jgi:regulator of replication initiation timing
MTEQDADRLLALMRELADQARYLLKENERLQAENAVLWQQVLNVEALVWDRRTGGSC